MTEYLPGDSASGASGASGAAVPAVPDVPHLDCHCHVGVEMLSYLQGNYPYAQMLPALLAEGAASNISHFVVFPMVTNLSLDPGALREGRIETGGGALESVPYAWENRRLLDEVYRLFPSESANRVFPFVMGDPLRRTAEQGAALLRLREETPGHRFYGLKFQTTMLQAPIKSLLTEGRVFLDLAAEWDLPLLIHSSVHPADPWAQASDILDIVEAFPRLRFCVAHSCRFDRVCLDRLAALPNAWFDCSAHRIHCRLAAENRPQVAPPDRRFPSDYTRPDVVLRDLAEAYPDKLLWGSDAPYQSFADRASGLSLFSTYAEEAACLHALPDALRRRAAWENARACFGLPHREVRS
jgi:predicted TIM-barrel fold metal-dependent hydrolase